MLKYVLLSLFMFYPLCSYAKDNDVLVMFWNLENFFDWTDNGHNSSDSDFSSHGKKHWNFSRFCIKRDLIAKSILWIGDRYGRLPDVIGLCEVENRGVLYKLLNDTLLRKYDYSIVHYDSNDRRGIDVALLYRKSFFKFLSSSLTTPEVNGVKLPTRDILEVTLQSENNDSVYHFIVNHHPSKFGGSKVSDSRRKSAMLSLKYVCDSLLSSKSQCRIIAMGDFNDNPSGSQFNIVDNILCNKSLSLFKSGKGTIRFKGKWDLIDMFLVDFCSSEVSYMDIVYIPFLMVWDNTYPGFKPHRTYSGPRYISGVSDHCPIILKLSFDPLSFK